MPSKGYSFHIGLNKADPNHYPGLEALRSAVNDAQDMQKLAERIFHFGHTQLVIDEEATAERVLGALNRYARLLQPGDLLLLTYSGHGGTVEDPFFMNKGGDEPEDETWCLYDRQLIDDELYEAFLQFREGVRILVVSDSCHSGTVTRVAPGIRNDDRSIAARQEEELEREVEALMKKYDYRSKKMPRTLATKVYTGNWEKVYKPVQEKFSRRRPKQEMQASVKLFAACQDNQIAFDGMRNGRFTMVLKNIILNEKWQNLPALDFFNLLKKPFSYPSPNYYAYGPLIPAFEQYSPFRIEVEGSVSAAVAPEEPAFPVGEGTGALQEQATPESTRPTAETAGGEPSAGAWRVAVELPAAELARELLLKLCPEGTLGLQFKGGYPSRRCLVDVDGSIFQSAWEVAHDLEKRGEQLGVRVEAEPAWSPNFPAVDELTGAKEAGESFDFMPFWPPVTTGEEASLVWHLDDAHSQLASARAEVWKNLEAAPIRERVMVAHLDTGYWSAHPAFANNHHIRKDLGRSLLSWEWRHNREVADVPENLKLLAWSLDNEGHGTGTLGLLAGWGVDPEATNGEDLGFIGGAPFAEVVPMRISDSVIIFDSDNFCDALEYAMDLGCEVLSMSMGGKPSRRMARLIDEAYERGMVLVTAAGNYIRKGPARIGPKRMVYPARFPRVIAACGACYNQLPYDFQAQAKYAPGAKGFDFDAMEGCWGPAHTMPYAMAAYTPNVPWLVKEEKALLKKSGGGTSSATPQIAAAAALWLLRHKKELRRLGYNGTWKQAEAVRQALFQSAYKKAFDDPRETQKYYGNGILRAMDALRLGVPEIDEAMKAPPSGSSWSGALELLKLIFSSKKAADTVSPALQEALPVELEGLLLDDDEGQELLEALAADSISREEGLERAVALLQRLDRASPALKGVLG